MKLKQAIQMGIESGMEYFEVYHKLNSSSNHTISKTEVFEKFKAWENDNVLTIYFGSAYCTNDEYHKPNVCVIEIGNIDNNL